MIKAHPYRAVLTVLGATLVMLLLSVYLVVANLQWRKQNRRGTAHPA